MSATSPRVLLVYYTYTQQTRTVSAALAEVFREHGCEVRAGGRLRPHLHRLTHLVAEHDSLAEARTFANELAAQLDREGIPHYLGPRPPPRRRGPPGESIGVPWLQPPPAAGPGRITRIA